MLRKLIKNKAVAWDGYICIIHFFLILVRNNIMPNTTTLAEKQIIKWCVAVNQIERLYIHIQRPSRRKERDYGDVD